MATQREESKQGWNGKRTIESINSGSLQRIADATEAMSQNYVRLQNERDMLSRWNREKNQTIDQLRRSNAALRGHVTRLKNKSNTEVFQEERSDELE